MRFWEKVDDMWAMVGGRPPWELALIISDWSSSSERSLGLVKVSIERPTAHKFDRIESSPRGLIWRASDAIDFYFNIAFDSLHR